MKKFGEKVNGVEYLHRPSAWVVIFDDAGRVLAVEFHGRYFLPGGGIERGESARDAINRELVEEIGWRVEIGTEICRAGQYLLAEIDQEQFYKDGVFFLAKLLDQVVPQEECEHGYLWLAPAAFEKSAAHESHIYAVKRAKGHAQ